MTISSLDRPINILLVEDNPGDSRLTFEAFRDAKIRNELLLATDGLLKYMSAERIVETCRQHPTDAAAQRLIELVRYPSGALPDDVTLILAKLEGLFV